MHADARWERRAAHIITTVGIAHGGHISYTAYWLSTLGREEERLPVHGLDAPPPGWRAGARPGLINPARAETERVIGTGGSKTCRGSAA